MKKEEMKAIVIFVDDDEVKRIRKRYDKRPIKPHLTLVYPFIPNKKRLLNLKRFVNKLEPFEISFKGFSKSKKEYYLYFDVKKNKKRLLNLHKKLYSLLGFKFNNPDMPKYIPHITMGVFSSKKDIDKAKKSLGSQNLVANYLIDTIGIITLGNGWKPKSIEDVPLNRKSLKIAEKKIVHVLSMGHRAYWNLPHAQEVLKQLLILKPDAKDYLKIAALGHDIERSLTGETDSKLKSMRCYRNYKKLHSLRSAKIVSKILKKSGVSEKDREKINLIIREHETGGHKDSNLIREADALAFFTFDIDIYSKENPPDRTKEKIRFTYNRLSTKSKKSVFRKKYSREIKRLLEDALK